MCGIFCSISREECQVTCNDRLLKNRGPDAYNEIKLLLDGKWFGFFAGSTLWTQGPEIKIQPLVHQDGSVLLWNGDKYSDVEKVSSKVEAEISKNDSEEVLSRLANVGIGYFEQITGPYSFIYYHSQKNELWFGRDVLGRHSLLWYVSNKEIILSSVSDQKSSNTLTELPSCGLFKISLSTYDISIDLFPWSHMIPKEIVSSVPFNVKHIIYHSILGTCTDYLWTTAPPKDELELFSPGDGPELVFASCLKNPLYLSIVTNLKDLLYKSVKRRVTTKPNFCKSCLLVNENCKHAKIGILFSGGLDSAILAFIADYFVPEDEPIDLFNVSFVRDAKHKFSDVPDRKTGMNALQELRLLCPKRCWNFVEINIGQEELENERQNHIVNLIYPLSSILDDSLGCALWFAARGAGKLNQQQYTSPSRVVLLGMGADEMFGGYSRHRVIFKKDGWKGLTRELYNDLRHIGERNLGRDNRVVADHGRQPRMPYLDEEFVAAVDSTPTWTRCCLHTKMPRGIGDKLLLRLLAWHLGLHSAASRPKKALQFGSRIADPKDKGHLISKHLII